MRFVVKPDADKTAKLASAQTYTELLAIAKKTSTNIKDSIYRDPYPDKDETRSRVEDQLARSYHNKCAYCERLCKADVEHYRPKKGVNEDAAHGGYYWLCYEWSNLLPACVKCNRDGGKHTKFPILGTRVIAPVFLLDTNLDLLKSKAGEKPLIDEQALLLHPEVDKPEDFFIFELDPRGEGIRLEGIDKDGRGKKTIEICVLNRQELRLERVENVISPFKVAIECVFGLLESGSISMDAFKFQVLLQIQILFEGAMKENSTHTYLRKYIVKNTQNFESIVIPFLTPKIRIIVLEAFKSK